MANEKRLIDAKALFQEFERAAWYDNADRDEIAEQILLEMPAVDAVEVVHGHWAIDEEDIKWGNSLKKRYCTNCGKRPHFDKDNREFIMALAYGL